MPSDDYGYDEDDGSEERNDNGPDEHDEYVRYDYDPDEYEPEEQEQERYYSTGEAARLLNIGFITLKRWIYDDKIDYEKTESGRYRIYQHEIDRLLEENRDYHAEQIKGLLSEKKVAYMREMQICLEGEYSHFDTSVKLKRMMKNGDLKSYQTRSGDVTYSWYHLSSFERDEVISISESKTKLMDMLHNHPKSLDANGIHYYDYSEYLVEKCFIQAGYTIVSKDSHYFNGQSARALAPSGPGRPSDLDFIVKLPGREIWAGVSVKNRTESVRGKDVALLVDFCKKLELKPLLITRAAGPTAFLPVSRLGGWIVVAKRYFLRPEFPRDKFKEIVDMGIPLGVYRREPKFLTTALVKAAKSIG